MEDQMIRRNGSEGTKDREEWRRGDQGEEGAGEVTEERKKIGRKGKSRREVQGWHLKVGWEM